MIFFVSDKAHCSHHSALCGWVDLGRAIQMGKIILLLVKSKKALKSNQSAAAEAELFQKENKRAKEKLHLVLKIPI